LDCFFEVSNNSASFQVKCYKALKLGDIIYEIGNGMMQDRMEEEVLKLGDKIDDNIDELKLNFVMNDIIEVGPYKPFEIIKILFGILGKAQSEFRKIGYEHTIKAPKPPVELKDKIESVSEFHEMWKCVLELLSGRLAHFEDLKKAVCYGDLNKTCWGCYKDFIVSKIFPTPSSWPDGTVSPLFMFGIHLNLSYCGKCNYKVAFERFLNMEQKWTKSKSLQKCEYCDFCGQRGGQRHRCITCHTKLYCGRECYDADQEVHKEFCKPYDEMMPWKVKDGFSMRRNDKMKITAQEVEGAEKMFSEIQDLLKKM